MRGLKPGAQRHEFELIPSPSVHLIPATLFTPTPKAAKRTLEFFTAQINNDHTRKAYLNATRRFAQWCESAASGSSPTCMRFTWRHS